MNQKRLIQLDGLRFIAVLMVMIAHWLQWQWGNEFVKSIPFHYGVVLFFVLSGFLITRILFYNRDEYILNKRNKLTLIKQFYIRRFLRIFPIYYILITLLFIIQYQNINEVVIWVITYTSNIHQSFYGEDLGNFNHLWSLAVEEQFYLFWPILILYLKPSKTPIVIILMIALAIIIRVYFYYHNYHWMANSYFTLSNMDSLGIGALLAYISLYREQWLDSLSKPRLLYLSIGFHASLFITASVSAWFWYEAILDSFTFSCISALIILRAVQSKFTGLSRLFLENNFVCYCGKISYGLYLYHLFVPDIALQLFPKIEYYNEINALNKYILFFIYFAITFLIAHLSWLIIESPLNRLKAKFPY